MMPRSSGSDAWLEGSPLTRTPEGPPGVASSASVGIATGTSMAESSACRAAAVRCMFSTATISSPMRTGPRPPLRRSPDPPR